MDFNSIIAQLFKRFQTLSPKVWAIIVFLLGFIKYGLESGYAQGLFAWVGEAGTQTVLGWVTWFLTAVSGFSFAASSKDE